MFEVYRPSRFRRERPGAARLALLFVIIAGIGIWSSIVALGFLQALPPEEIPSPLFVGTAVYYLVGYVAPVIGYSRVVGLDVLWGPPTADDLPTTLVALVAPAALVAAVSAVGNLAVGVSMSELARTYYAPAVGLQYVLWSGGVTALLKGTGVGLLLFGVVQGSLREVLEPGHVAAFTAFFGLCFEVYPLTLSAGRLDPPMLALFALAVVFSVAAGATVGLAYRTVVRQGEPLASLREGPYLLLLVVGVVGLVLLVEGLAEYPDIVTVPMWTLAVGAGALAVERSRSVWPGVVALAGYELAVAVTVYAEAVMGFVPGP